MRKQAEKGIVWRTEKRRVSDLIPNPRNPRRMTEKQREELEKSLKKFNLAEIPAVNTDNRIIAGHMRVATLRQLGRENELIDVRVPSRKLSRKEYSEYLLRSNQNHGDFKWDILADTFDVDELLNAGFDEELGFMFDDVTSLTEDGFSVERTLKAIGKPETKPGEIVRLGRHVLMCGDATKPEDVKKLMGGEKTSFVFCDSPYNIGLDYSKGIGTREKYRGKYSAQDDKKKPQEYLAFLGASIRNALAVSRKDAHVFYWCDESFTGKMQQLFEDEGITNRRICIWVKNNQNPTPHVAFNKITEHCVYGTIGKPYLRRDLKNFNEILNRNVESGNQVADEILEMINVWLVKRDNAREYEHPTQKPITLCERPMKRCTKPGDIVLDLFGGSGSTLIAAEQLNRRAFVMEIDPVFCDVIKRRYREFIKR